MKEQNKENIGGGKIVLLYTIGHSNFSFEEFFSYVEKHNLKRIIDVRYRPYSGHVPHFNREVLKKALASRGVSYLFAGHGLGNDNRIAYDKYRDALGWLIHQCDGHTAIMCSEREPNECHRFHKISKDMKKLDNGIKILHIIRDTVVDHDELDPQILLF